MLEVECFVIAGDWDDTSTPAGKLRIIMPPLGHVFGAGWHPITQVALEALVQHITPGCSFAEIGAGSGILCVAAKLLGAGKCYATELDTEALAAARRVFLANRVDVSLINGTFIDTPVDVCLVSISDEFAVENRSRFNAKVLLSVTNDARVEIL